MTDERWETATWTDHNGIERTGRFKITTVHQEPIFARFKVTGRAKADPWRHSTFANLFNIAVEHGVETRGRQRREDLIDALDTAGVEPPTRPITKPRLSERTIVQTRGKGPRRHG